MPIASQKYKNFRDYSFPLHPAKKERRSAQQNPAQSRENSPATTGGTFGHFLLSVVCGGVLLPLFQTQGFLSRLQIDLLRARSLCHGKRFELFGKKKTLEFLEIYFGLIFIWAPISAFHSRFFVPLRSTKRAPFKSGRRFRLKLNFFSNDFFSASPNNFPHSILE